MSVLVTLGVVALLALWAMAAITGWSACATR